LSATQKATSVKAEDVAVRRTQLCETPITNSTLVSEHVTLSAPYVLVTFLPAYRTVDIHQVFVRRRPRNPAGKIGIGPRTKQLLRRVSSQLSATCSRPDRQ